MPLPKPGTQFSVQPAYKKSWMVKYKGEWHKVLEIKPPTAGNVTNSYVLDGVEKPVPAKNLESELEIAASFRQQLAAKYVVRAETYDWSEMADILSVGQSKCVDYKPASGGGWHDPARGAEAKIEIQEIVVKPGDEKEQEVIDQLKINDVITVNFLADIVLEQQGKVEQFTAHLKGKIKITKITKEKDEVRLGCQHLVKVKGREHPVASLQFHRVSGGKFKSNNDFTKKTIEKLGFPDPIAVADWDRLIGMGFHLVNLSDPNR
jgi:hypothetical protein